MLQCSHKSKCVILDFQKLATISHIEVRQDIFAYNCLVGAVSNGIALQYSYLKLAIANKCKMQKYLDIAYKALNNKFLVND